MTASDEWRDRLRIAVERSGRKRAAIARDAGIAPETLSRILNAEHAAPSFDTVVRIAKAAGTRVGWLLGETFRGIELTEEDRRVLRSGRDLIDRILGNCDGGKR